MSQCDLCEHKLNFIKFKYQSGAICKHCYRIVSLHYTKTIKQKTLQEIRSIHRRETDENRGMIVSFEATRKIGQMLLFDDKQQLICLPNNKRYIPEKLPAEYFSFDQIIDCKLLEQGYTSGGKQPFEIGTLKIRIKISGRVFMIREIMLIPRPIDSQSHSYKAMLSLGRKIVTELDKLKKKEAVKYASEA